ncbi:hypothetical protein Cgig2_008134 [Carnegiea gigantea]|uniref:BHLH domain-containing protein n=1 Tax=Carnegiea gigantea TaxID=171969 RepID=A0A9Q1L245_9CARY|nr:hypothetical protein Cgig2_008134 [Carnegiea gigantea]
MGGPNGSRLQQMLQAAVQAVQWTYSLFWRFCPQQGMLVWEDGYYNGAIKTRKTVQPMEVSAEEASLQRSQQLRELYDSLAAGESSQPPARRPCAALSPEDLTESEWFYLMCVSFSFPPGVGLPGKAYAKCQHVWLTGANEVDSSVFSRAILAKVQEDPSFIQQVKGFFNDHHHHHQPPPPVPPPKPALSGHSTSNPAASSSGRSHFGPTFIPTTAAAAMYTAANPPPSAATDGPDGEEDEEEDEDEEDSEAETRRVLLGQVNPGLAQPDLPEQSELMQLELSEDIRVGSPEDASNNLDSDFHVVGGLTSHRRVHSFRAAESTRRWPNLHQLQQHHHHQQSESLIFSSNGLQLPPSGATPIEEELSQEDTHYSQTVSIILQLQSATAASSYLAHSPNSAFLKWTSRSDPLHLHHHAQPLEGTSQWLLKYILFTVPFLHTKYDNTASPKSSLLGRDASRGPRPNKVGGTPQDELSANHVLAERRRREKLNERFIVLRSLVPFVTKMDKASILGDTIEYVKQLRKKIQDLEERALQMEAERVRLLEATKGNTVVDKRKVKENANGKKASIVEVKRAINQVIPHTDVL